MKTSRKQCWQKKNNSDTYIYIRTPWTITLLDKKIKSFFSRNVYFSLLLSLSLTLSYSSLCCRKKGAKVFASLLVLVLWLVDWLLRFFLTGNLQHFRSLKVLLFFLFFLLFLFLQMKTLTKSFNGNYTQKPSQEHGLFVFFSLFVCS